MSKRDGRIITATFAFRAHSVRHPKHARMIKKHGLEDRLHHVDQIVVTSNMRQFMRNDRVELHGRQTRQYRARNQNDWTQPTYRDGYIDMIRLHPLHCPPDVQTPDQIFEVAGIRVVEPCRMTPENRL